MTCTEEYKEHKQTSRSCITNLFRRGSVKLFGVLTFTRNRHSIVSIGTQRVEK